MVKHKYLDLEEGTIQVGIPTKVKIEFFCFRCNYRKKDKIKSLWKTKEGKK